MSNNNTLMRVANKSLEVKSLKDLVRVRTSENSVLLIDVSASMDYRMRNGKRRIEGLREVVSGIQSKRTTQMIAFGLRQPTHSLEPTSPMVAFVNEIPEPQGSTPLAEAIDFARANNFGRAVVISDGEPNPLPSPLDAARNFGGRIDVIYVGDPGGHGSYFLDQLAKSTGGFRFEGDLSEVKELATTVVGLLMGAEMEEDDEEDDEEEDDEEEDDDDGDEE